MSRLLLFEKYFPNEVRYLIYKSKLKFRGINLSNSNVKKLIIIGCGRSGTTYTSQLLKKNGYDVGHEVIGANGISSWYLVSDKQFHLETPGFDFFKNYEFTVVHQVRNPLDSISSMLTAQNYSWDFIDKELSLNMRKESILLQSMKYWFYWNKAAQKKAVWTYKIEELDENLSKLLSIAKFKTKKIKYVDSVSKKTNSRKHRSLSWQDLEDEDLNLTHNIKELAREYGYLFK